MTNDFDFSPEQVLQDLLNQQDTIDPAAEELRRSLNGIIASRQLTAQTVLAVLSRISAGYVHQMQKQFDAAGSKDVVEEVYHNMFQAYLTSFDMSDVGDELRKSTNLEAN